MSESSISKRNVTAKIEIIGINVPDDMVDKPIPVMVSFDQADYTKPRVLDEVSLDVTGGTCICSCNGTAGHGTGGCCSCLGSSGMGQ